MQIAQRTFSDRDASGTDLSMNGWRQFYQTTGGCSTDPPHFVDEVHE